MRRLVLSFLVLSLSALGLVAPPVPTAQAAPLPTPYSASATASVARVSTTLLGIPVVGLGLAQSVDTVDSTTTPGSTASSRNVSAAVAGLPMSVSSGSQTAPPDHTVPGGGPLLGLNAGILSLGALDRSNLARWTGDAVCLPAGGTLTQSSTETTGLSVTGLLGLGVSSSATTTSLVTGSSALNRAVRSAASGSVAGVSLLGGAVTATVSESPVLTATASGVAGGATVTRNNPVVTVTGPGGPVVLQLGATPSTTISVPVVGSVTVSLNPPSSVVQSGDGRTASADWNFLDVDVTLLLGAGRVQATLLPLRAVAGAPLGGIDCPPPAPVITTPAEGASTGPLPTIRGTAVPGATVALTLDGVVVGTVTADGAGDWQYTRPAGSPLAEGPHVASATQTVAGATGPPTPDRTFVVDTTAPAAPVVTSPANGSRTNDSTPAYVGTAEGGSTVEVLVDGVPVGTTTAAAGGGWTVTPTTPLADGTHTVAARATDTVGNTGPTSATNTFTVDTVAPVAPVVTTPADGSRTNDDTPAYAGTAEGGSTVEVLVDGASVGTTTAAAGGGWTFTPSTPLADGTHTVAARATDAAGNTGPTSATNTFTVDATPPAAPVVTDPLGGSRTRDTTPAYVGTAEPSSTVTVLVDGVPVGTTTATAGGTWTLTQPTALADGAHVISARATDADGNTGPDAAPVGFTVDTVAPAAPVVTAPTAGTTTRDSTPTYLGTAEAGSTVEVSVDGVVVGTTTADGAGAWSFTQPTALPDGPHAVTARATDEAGSTGPPSASVGFTVDTTAPAAPVVTSPLPGASTADATPTYVGTAEPGATVQVLVDGTPVGTTTADGTGAWTLTQPATLADGAHQVTARATDAVGNTGPLSAPVSFTVDTSAPGAPVVLAPVNGSTVADPTPTYSGTADPRSTVTISVDTAVVGTTTADGAGAWSFTQPTVLGEGGHVVTAHATDAQGNTGPESAVTAFTVDTTAPLAPLVTAPADRSTTVDSTPAYVGSAEPGATVQVIVDGSPVGTTAADGTGAWTLAQPSALADGTHTVAARATDGVGNIGPVSAANTFTVDTTAPVAPVVTDPADNSRTNDPTPLLAGTAEPGATVQVLVNGVPVGTTTADGAGDWSLTQPTALADGAHTVAARATDAVGNTGPLSPASSFTVDTTAPAAPAVTDPAEGDRLADRTPGYVGTAEPGATVQVLVDGVAVGTTTADGAGDWSLTQPTPLPDGTHTVAARATDGAGNTGPTSAPTTFLVDATAPVPPVITSPSGNPTYQGPDVGVAGTGEPGATVTVTATSGASSATVTATVSPAGTWSTTLTGLADGAWTATATQADAAGNASGTSAPAGFVVDSSVPAAPVIHPFVPDVSTETLPTVSGTGEPGAEVTVRDRTTGTTYGPVTVTGDGSWSLSLTVPLTEGTHVFTATQEDAGDNTSGTSDPESYTVDTVAPAAPVVTAPANGSTTTDSTPTLSGTSAPGTVVTVRLDGAVVGTVTVDGSGTWSVPVTVALADGPHTVTATARDAAGNTSGPGSGTFTVDTTSTTPVVTSPLDGSSTRDTTPLLAGSADAGDTVTVLVDGDVVGTVVADADGRWSLPTTTALAPGEHVVTARAQDPFGNTSGTSVPVRFTVDLDAPAPPVITSPLDGSTTSDRTPPVRGTGEVGATVTVSVDGLRAGTALVAGDGTWELALTGPLPDGSHVVSATQADAAGNASGAADPVRITIDATAPSAPTITAPVDGSVISERTPVVRGTGEPGARLVAHLDGVTLGTTTVAADGTWSIPVVDDLADGPHTARATQTDAAGNVSPEVATRFVVGDVAGPVITSPADGDTLDEGPVVIRGTGEPGAMIVIRDDSGTELGRATVDLAGRFSLTATLAPGTWDLVAVQTLGVADLSSPVVTVRVLEVVGDIGDGAGPPPGAGLADPDRLAQTGAQAEAMLVTALVLLLCGAGLVVLARRRRWSRVA